MLSLAGVTLPVADVENKTLLELFAHLVVEEEQFDSQRRPPEFSPDVGYCRRVCGETRDFDELGIDSGTVSGSA